MIQRDIICDIFVDITRSKAMLMRWRPFLPPAVAPLAVLLLLCLVLFNPTYAFARHLPSENDHGVTVVEQKGRLAEDSSRFSKIPALEEERTVLAHDTTLETVPSEEITEGEMKECFDPTTDSKLEECELDDRMLLDYGPPVRNPDVRPGGPL